MSGTDQRTRLVAILAADAAGYSRLMAADEAATVAALDAARAVFRMQIESTRGRVIDMAGDSVLAVFELATGAVTAALAIQQELNSGLSDVPADRRMHFRIGVHLGEIIEKVDGTVYGDGVNVAARLQAQAEPGGVCISEIVRQGIAGKIKLGLKDLGELKLKNIETPVHGHLIVLDSTRRDGSRRWRPSGRTRWRFGAAVAVLTLILIAVWWRPWEVQTEPAAIERMAHPLPGKPSIVVLPFRNDSDDPKMEFFAGGLTGDLTTALSKAPGLFVIARNSATTYKGTPYEIKQVAEELGVQYVLEGSVRKEGDRLRIGTQMVDALSGRHVWAGRYDRPVGDVFSLQDEITQRIIEELRVKLTEGDRARVLSQKTRSFDAWLSSSEAYGEYLKFTPEATVRARELWESAWAADPDFSVPVAGIALTHWAEARWGWSASQDESIRLATDFAKRAIEIDPTVALGYQALGTILFLRDRPEEAIEARRKAIELAPNDFTVLAGLAIRLSEFGQEHQAVELFERSLRLSPKPPWWVPAGYGYALHLVGRNDEAANWLRQAVATVPKRTHVRARLTAVYVDLGKLDDARSEAAEILKLDSTFTISKLQKVQRFRDPKRNEWLRDLLLRAGLPE